MQLSVLAELGNSHLAST